MAVGFIGGGNRSTRRKPLTNFITYFCIEYTSAWTGFELTTLVVIGTDCTGSCKSNYHMITTTTAPINIEKRKKTFWKKCYKKMVEVIKWFLSHHQKHIIIGCIKEHIILLLNGMKLVHPKQITSATLRNSPTLSIRTKNLL